MPQNFNKFILKTVHLSTIFHCGDCKPKTESIIIYQIQAGQTQQDGEKTHFTLLYTYIYGEEQ